MNFLHETEMDKLNEKNKMKKKANSKVKVHIGRIYFVRDYLYLKY